MDLPQDWNEFFRLLSLHRVRFLVVGAHALAANGRPRATADLDIFVEPTPANARALVAALTAFGFRAFAAEVEAFSTPDRMATLGHPPLRIDIMTSITGVSFTEAWRTRLKGKMADNHVFFLGRAALIKNKLASGRAKDLADVAILSELEDSVRPARARSSPMPAKKTSKGARAQEAEASVSLNRQGKRAKNARTSSGRKKSG
jgi:hypothetical protein